MQRYHSLQPKTIFYKNDGTSRDTYISVNGGGYTKVKQTLPPIDFFKLKGFKNVTQKQITNYQTPRVLHYKADGSGRDTYINYDEGGNSFNYKDHQQTDRSFQQNLRSYNKLDINYKVDYFQQSQSLLSQRTWRKQNEIYKSQLQLTQRLIQKH